MVKISKSHHLAVVADMKMSQERSLKDILNDNCSNVKKQYSSNSNRSHIPRGFPKICSKCFTDETSAWRVLRLNGEKARVCNKCAMKLKYQPSNRKSKASVLKKEISNILLKAMEPMTVNNITKQLEDTTNILGPNRKSNRVYVSALLARTQQFMKIRFGVYDINKDLN